MKRFLVAAVMGVSLALSGCAAFGPVDNGIKVDQSAPKAVQTVQKLVLEARILLAAIANTYAQNVADGVRTKEEGKAMYDKLFKYSEQLDEVDALLDQGKTLEAKNKAELINQLVVALHAAVAKEASK